VELTIGPFWSLTRSQVYRELATLAAAGLVAAGEVGQRDSRPYSITAEGRIAFSRWAARGPGQATVRLPLLLFVALGRHIGPATLLPMLREQRQEQAEILRGYLALRPEAAAGGVDVFQLATLDYGIAHARATVRWLDTLCSALAEPSGSEQESTDG
jgi:DNA-binding PadR family transcriptional regulator